MKRMFKVMRKQFRTLMEWQGEQLMRGNISF